MVCWLPIITCVKVTQILSSIYPPTHVYGVVYVFGSFVYLRLSLLLFTTPWCVIYNLLSE